MSEKFGSDFSGGPPDEFDGDLSKIEGHPAWYAAEREREDDFRIKMFALDMAVQALPTLSSSVDSEDTKFFTLRRAAAEFEKILRGGPVA